MTKIDAIDQVLLRELQKNARRSNRQLARAARIAESTCHERMRRLLASGVIAGFHAEVDVARLGRSIQAIIAVRLKPKTRQAVERFRDFVVTLPEVLAVFVVSGSDDFLVQVAVRDTRHLEDFVLDHIAQYSHTEDVRTSLVYEHLPRRPIEHVDTTA